jgi:DNA-directed RNA polymerase specialized sigma24 family protein
VTRTSPQWPHTALGMLAADLSYAEIDARRGWTYTKVNRCIAEGRAALRKRLAD